MIIRAASQAGWRTY